MLLVSIGTPTLWIGFTLFILAMLALDLGVFHRKSHVVSFREATIWSLVWVALAAVFGAGVWHFAGPERGLEFFTGWVIEKTLSVDNIFVIVMLFGAFAIPPQYQHRVLFWGILGALVMRGLFIWAGAEMLEHFHWTIYVFGGLLMLTGLKMLLVRDGPKDPMRSPVVRLARRILPTTDGLRGERFWVREGGRLLATPLLLVLVAVEFTDLIFAVDSIPAIFAVTNDPFLVYTANVFAILGLRSLYFLLAGVVDRFIYLKVGLALVLVFVGAKMAVMDWVKIPIATSLLIVASLIGTSIVASLLVTRGRAKTV